MGHFERYIPQEAKTKDMYRHCRVEVAKSEGALARERSLHNVHVVCAQVSSSCGLVLV